MARRRDSLRWDHTAATLAQQHNLHRSKDTPAKAPRDVHPYHNPTPTGGGMSRAQLHSMRASLPVVYAQ